jgi:hypothetical protein
MNKDALAFYRAHYDSRRMTGREVEQTFRNLVHFQDYNKRLPLDKTELELFYEGPQDWSENYGP